MNLFRISSLVVLASKLDDLIKKYPKFESDIKELNKSVPQKYLEWSAKQLVSGSKLVDLIPTIKSFDKSPNKFKFQDINRYKTSKELEDEVKELSEKGLLESKTQKSKQISVNDAKKLYEDQQYILIRPDTKAAVQKYGRGTKWCITMGDQVYYDNYVNQGIIFYFLLDKQDQSKKYAVSVYRDNDDLGHIKNYESHDAKNDPINKSDIPLWDKIESIIKSDIGSAPVPQISMAKNQSTSHEVLDKLADSSNERVRNEVAKNRNTTPDTLSKLSKDSSANVRHSVAVNHNTPQESLDILSNDPVSDIKTEVAKNPNTSQESLDKLSNDPYWGIRYVVAENKNTSPDTLLKLSKDSNWNVRYIASENPNTPL